MEAATVLPAAIDVDGLRIDDGQRIVDVDGVPVDLTATEFDVLACLKAACPDVVSVSRLGREVWGASMYFDKRALEVAISRLRKKLGDDPSDPRFIQTVRSIGYRFLRPSTREHVASFLYDADLRITAAWAADWSRFGGEPEVCEDPAWLPPFENSLLREHRWTRSLAQTMFGMGLRHASGRFLLEGSSSDGGGEDLWAEADFYGEAGSFNGMFIDVFTDHPSGRSAPAPGRFHRG